MGLKFLDPFLLRPKVGLLEKGGGPYVLCDMGAQSWPVPISACAPSVSSQVSTQGCAGSWLLVNVGVEGQGIPGEGK